MIFQDPMTSLNPVLTIGRQIREVLETHFGMDKGDAEERTAELLDRVGIPNAPARLRDYPHQFSGGMRQRAMIAMALACEPKLLIADEPTTALDVTIQAQILDLLRTLVAEQDTALILITHDLGVVAGTCERVNVMYAGMFMETGTAEQVFANPRHPYTLGLLQSVPRLDAARKTALHPIEGNPRNMLESPQACPFAPRCRYEVEESTEVRAAAGADRARPQGRLLQPGAPGRVPEVAGGGALRMSMNGNLVELTDLKMYFPIKSGIVMDRHVGDIKAVDGVSLEIKRGETLGLVGESGCGKSTVGRTILRLYEPTEGTILFAGQDITRLGESELRPLRRRMQMIFQDPYSSLNPRHSVGRIIGEPMTTHGIASRREANARVRELLQIVGLPADAGSRYPHEFSGGQRQRVGLARSLSLNPDLIVADEPVSALDVSIQAQIINLLENLQSEFELTYLFIAHDLAVVRHISDRIAVMYLGTIVEISPAEELYDNPLHPYTISLLTAVPIPDPVIERQRERILLAGDLPSPANPPPACRFHTRCPYVQPTRCKTDVPALRKLADGHFASCHWAEDIKEGRIQPHKVEAVFQEPLLAPLPELPPD